MTTKLKVFAAAAVLLAATSSGAFARYPCAPGYALHHNICYPVGVNNYSNPVSGAATGEAHGAASGTLNGTANMLSGR
jgi:hypothetical protein